MIYCLCLLSAEKKVAERGKFGQYVVMKYAHDKKKSIYSQRTMKEIVTWAILFMAQQDAWGRMMVQLPRQYTAMKGDVEVLYALDANSTDLKSFNAMIHIEYLPGDSVLTNSHTATSSIHLAR